MFHKFIRRNFSKSQNIFQHSIELECKLSQITLKPLSENHFNELSSSLNFPDLWTFNPRFMCKNLDDIKAYLKHALLQKEKKERYPFIIFNTKENRIIGTTSLYNISTSNKTVSLGYTIIPPEFQRTGVNRASKTLLLDWCFKQMDFERLDFHVDKLNEKSINSLKKFGAIQEGILRSNILLVNGRRRDTMILSILKDEWLNRNI